MTTATNLTAHLSYACMLAVALRCARLIAAGDMQAAKDDALMHESAMTDDEKLVFETAIQRFTNELQSAQLDIPAAQAHLRSGGSLHVTFTDGARFVVQPINFFEGETDYSPQYLETTITPEAGGKPSVVSIRNISRYLDQSDVVSVMKAGE